MFELIMFVVGFAVGAVALWLYLSQHFAKLKEIARQGEQAKAQAAEQIRQAEELRSGAQRQLAEVQQQQAAANAAMQDLQAREKQLAGRVVSYRELQEENAILRRDLQNLDVNMHKLELDGEARDQRQVEIRERADALAKRYLAETVKAVVSAIGSNNYAACKARLSDAIERVRGVGFNVPAEQEALLHADLRAEFEKAVRADFERQEQARIKAQIREEERLKREIERELKQLERERAAVQAALDQALAEAKGQHTAEVERLQARLAEAEAKAQRTLSMAQQTKAGNVYVISNIGCFGTDVYKVGMTRRLEPQDRVDELGDASVPFPFDVHMMIRCDNAPKLENALHRALHRRRVNKANPRKEFFRATLTEILELVKEHHGEVQYVADAEALEYRQSLAMSEADQDFIEAVYDANDKDAATGED